MTENGKIASALTAEEWRYPSHRAPSDHAVAALALHGQPFGFTAADVALLDEIKDQANEPFPLVWSDDEMAQFTSLRDRIAALLPPGTIDQR